MTTIVLTIVWFVLFALAFIWLMYTGAGPQNDEVKVTFMDSIWLDIGGIALVLIEFVMLALFHNERIDLPGAGSGAGYPHLRLYGGRDRAPADVEYERFAPGKNGRRIIRWSGGYSQALEKSGGKAVPRQKESVL